jgi:hypothetical protein
VTFSRRSPDDLLFIQNVLLIWMGTEQSSGLEDFAYQMMIFLTLEDFHGDPLFQLLVAKGHQSGVDTKNYKNSGHTKG